MADTKPTSARRDDRAAGPRGHGRLAFSATSSPERMMFGDNRKTDEALQQRREAMERLKLAAKNAKLTILVGWIGAALGIIGAGMIWGWGGVLLSFGLWLYTTAIRAERKQ
jgi:hypothetical protein